MPFSTFRLSVANWAIGGSFIGLLLGFYDARQSNAVSAAPAREREASRQARRLAVMNRILRHDIRNKLTIISGHVDLLDAKDADESLDSIKRAADDLLDIAERVRILHTVTEMGSRRAVNLAGCVESAIAELGERYPEAELTAHLTDDIEALTYPIVEDNIHDLLQNAVDHNDHEESDVKIEVDFQQTRRAGDKYAEVVITDNWPGISSDVHIVLEEESETQLHHSREPAFGWHAGLWKNRIVTSILQHQRLELLGLSFDCRWPPDRIATLNKDNMLIHPCLVCSTLKSTYQ